MPAGLAAVAAALLAGATAAEPSVVPLDIAAPASTIPVPGGDRLHLLYELRLTNFAARPLALQGLEVRDLSGRALATFDAAALKGMIAGPSAVQPGQAEAAVPPGGFVTLFLDTPAPRGSSPDRLIHRFRVRSERTDAPASRTVVEGGQVAVSTKAPLVLGAPLRGNGWLAANALSNDSDHRRTVAVVDGRARISQRYAIDFVQLDARGRAFQGEPSSNAAWTGYGAAVLAVADGQVLAVKDDLPDNSPGAQPSVPISLSTVGGNNVVLDIGGGRKVFYGHLQQGGALVKPGQHVRRGQTIGRLGNSGQSDAPHLHLHVSDGATALGGDGIAYVFDRFAVRGYVPSLAVLERPDGWNGAAEATPRSTVRELPLANAVIDFEP